MESEKVAGDLYEGDVNDDEADSEDMVEDDVSELSVVVELESSSIAILLRSLVLLLPGLVEETKWFELVARGRVSSLGGVIDRRFF